MVYFLVLIEQDQAVRPAAYAEYIAQVRPIVERYGGRYLVRTDQVIPMQEGDCPDRMILIEWAYGGKRYTNHYMTGFPSFRAEDARRWYARLKEWSK